MHKEKIIQMTNKNIGVVNANGFIPFGTITRRVDCGNCCSTFTISSSNTDTITINEEGYYKITYSITDVATAVGLNTITLVVNGVDTYTVGETVAVAGDAINLDLPYVVRVFKRCDNVATNNPMTIQVRADDAITSATANIIIERIY
jgi:hypothetical protein